MQGFVETLESRALLSGTTSAMLLADKSLISSDAAAVKADLAQLVAGAKTEDAPILAALKGVSPSTNGPLLKSWKSAESAVKASLTKDVSLLLSRAGSLANKSAAAGESLVKKSTSGEQAKVTAAIAALNAVCTTPLAAVQSQLASTTVTDALNALNSANPSVSNLSADITTRENDAASRKIAIGNAAAKFQTDVLALATDLGNIPSSSSTIPNVVGNYRGTIKVVVAQKGPGSVGFTMDVTSEGTDGTIVGTATVKDTNGTEGLAMSGSVAEGGALSATLTPVTAGDLNSDVTLSGTVNGKNISGTFVTGGGSSGTFTLKLA